MAQPVGKITKNASYNAMRNANQKNSADINDVQLRRQAQIEGKALFENWLQVRTADGSIKKILDRFNEDGTAIAPLTATTFSDLYKWTMMPVIRKLEAVKGPITVTFGIDLRNKNMRAAMKAGDGVVSAIYAALDDLTKRTFDINVFKGVLQPPRNTILTEDDIKAICTADDGSARKLVDGGIQPRQATPMTTPPADPNKVYVYFYYNEDAEYESGENGMHFIEAVGPWHKVTWLETSLMQCVYQAKLRYDFTHGSEVKPPRANTTFDKWLYGSLTRCAKSVAYTRLIQKNVSDIKPALFTGRRTGGFAFILLQNLFFADHFTQAGDLFGGMTASTYQLPEGSDPKTVALGTSSVDAWYVLKSLNLPCLNPAGTNAHELRMVTQILYPEIDNKYGTEDLKVLPLTQVLVDHLYKKCVYDKVSAGGPAPMPMLPDTLGTRAYLKAATFVSVDAEHKTPYLTLITSARQDSGGLQDFIDNIAEFGYKGSKMASEIDTSADLLKAATLNYEQFGAGGFFGDSEKVWSVDTEAPSNSMAVKAVRVSYAAAKLATNIPYITFADGKVTGYPLKIGDPKGRFETGLTSKLSIDKNKADLIDAIKKYANKVRELASKKEEESPTVPTLSIDDLMEEAGIASAEGGRRRGRSRRSKTKKARRSAKRSGSTRRS